MSEEEKIVAEENERAAEKVRELLKDMLQQFEVMSNNLIQKVDEMATRVDELEQNINEVMKQVQNPENGKAISDDNNNVAMPDSKRF